MADRWAIANGNWSNTATWDGGTLPTTGDDVYADGKSVTIDQNVTVASVRTTQRSGGTAGGGFTLNSGYTLTANVIAGTTTCVAFSAAGGSATITGNITGGAGATNFGAVTNTNTGTLTVNGNVTGGAGTGENYGIRTSSSGTVTVNGNVTGGTALWCLGCYITGSNRLNVNGAVTSGTGGLRRDAIYLEGSTSSCVVVGNVSSSAASSPVITAAGSTVQLTVTGNITSVGGEGLVLSGANCTCTVTGNAYGGGGASAIRVGGASSLTLNGNASGGTGSALPGVYFVGSGASLINGTVTPGTAINAAGCYAETGATGSVRIKRIQGNGYGKGSVGITKCPALLVVAQGFTAEVDEIEFGSLGATPVDGPVYIKDLSTNVAIMPRVGTTAKTLVDPASVTRARIPNIRGGADQ